MTSSNPAKRRRGTQSSKCPPELSDSDDKHASPRTTRSSSKQHGRNENQGGSLPQQVPTSMGTQNLPMQVRDQSLAHNGSFDSSQPPLEDGITPHQQGKHKKRGGSPLQKFLTSQENPGQSTQANDVGSSSRFEWFKIVNHLRDSFKLSVAQQDIQLRLAEAPQPAERVNLNHLFHKAELMFGQCFNMLILFYRLAEHLSTEKGKLSIECQNLRTENSSCVKERRSLNRLKDELTQKENEIRNLGQLVQLQNVELQKGSSGRGSWMKLEREQLNGFCGSYTDESATPLVLHTALCITKHAISRFQDEFFEVTRKDAGWCGLLRSYYSTDRVFFARPNHLGYFVGYLVYHILFAGFENESFDTFSGISAFLDPSLRQARFYEYYLRERQQKYEGIVEGDPQFKEFCETKLSSVWKTLFPCHRGRSVSINQFANLGGPQLDLSFREAVKSVWLLQKLAFSFEPPASIFRVRGGADIDPQYMETVVQLEDDERFVPRVGFMVAPGLRLRNKVMRCEVYLDAGPTPTPQ